MKSHLEMAARSPYWAIKPDAFASWIFEIKAGTFFQSQDFSLLKPSSLGKSRSNRVAVIPVQNILTKDCDWAGTTYPFITDAVESAAKDPTVKSIVLAVDSPGGEVVGLPETAATIASAARVKPVHACVEGMAASAAYWLITQATDITVAPSGEVGSVGVRMMHADISKALSDAGISVTEMSAGKYKTEWSPFHALTDDAKDDMQSRLDSIHRDFLTAVRLGRGRRATAGIAAARYGEGRMFSAREAMGHGLADNVLSPREFYRAITPAEEGAPHKGLPLTLARARLDQEKKRFTHKF
jgi:capsid assembly protease